MKIKLFFILLIVFTACQINNKKPDITEKSKNSSPENSNPSIAKTYRFENDSILQELFIYEDFNDSIDFHINCENYSSQHAASIGGIAIKIPNDDYSFIYDLNGTKITANVFVLKTEDCDVIIKLDTELNAKCRLNFEKCYSTQDGFCDMDILNLVN